MWTRVIDIKTLNQIVVAVVSVFSTAVPIIVTLMPTRDGEDIVSVSSSATCGGLNAAQVAHMQSTVRMLNVSICNLNITLSEIMGF